MQKWSYKSDFPCWPLAHHILVCIRTNQPKWRGIWWVRVCMCHLPTPIFSNRGPPTNLPVTKMEFETNIGSLKSSMGLRVSFPCRDARPLDSRKEWVGGIRMYVSTNHHPTTNWWSTIIWRAMGIYRWTLMLPLMKL